MTKLSPEMISLLRKTIAEPCLANSHELETHLIAEGFQRMIFGRFNQKSSFDASLTTARRLAGYAQSSREFTPRNAAQRFLNPN